MSYNGLHVPLDIGTWNCILVPANEYRSPSGDWLCFVKGDELQQLEADRRAFDLYFRPNYDFRSLIRGEIEAIRSFVRDLLKVAHWNLPTDNARIERMLKQSVRDGRVVPIVDRERRSPTHTYRPTPAPLRWPPSGGSSPAVQVTPYVGRLSAAESGGLAAVGTATAVERTSASDARNGSTSLALQWVRPAL
ncbi:hypothetical protein [Paraburkholderia humisilvae]|uniref:Uncharacterized protein n=1 Tax=Paraburkholderia humisilvae TaxID=627669 RepID=A0A6J5F6I9_9BURK|nr:hypothetical protein [Paraburkholderia humisilvae]CAB3772945.1 hypothetical protein LMG29542_07043 [Paraburkholderia humisilvae]